MTLHYEYNILSETKIALSNLYFDVHCILYFIKRLGVKIFYGSYRNLRFIDRASYYNLCK